MLTLTALGCAATTARADGLEAARPRRLSISESFVFPEWLAAIDAAAATNPAVRAFRTAWQGTANAAPPGGSSHPDVTLLSLPAPGVEMVDADRARLLARLANDRLAETVARSRGRLAGLATLAAFDPEAVDEARRAITVLGLSGLSLGANRGLRLDHRRLRPVFAFAAAAGVPIYLPASHAPITGDAGYRAEGREGILAGAAQESAAHATQLIFGGVLDAHPGLRVVLSRLGEGTPYWCTRLAETCLALEGAGRPLPRRPALAYFTDNILLTTADMSSPETLAFCDSVLGKGRLLHAAASPGVPRSGLRLAGDAELRPARSLMS